LLETRIAETKARSERLQVRIDRLKHDPGMLERLAREDLGMVRPGDLVIELPEDGAPVPARPRQQPLLAPAPVPPVQPQVIPASDSAGPAASPPLSPPPASPGGAPNGPA
jgi:hypothetical protein